MGPVLTRVIIMSEKGKIISVKMLALSIMTITILMAVIGAILHIPFASALSEKDLEIEDKETSKKTVDVDEEADFRWELINKNNISMNIRIIIMETDKEWLVEMDVPAEFELGPGNANSTVVTIKATPLSEEAPIEQKISVLFSASSGGDMINVQKSVIVNREHEVLIFGLLENPLPTPLDNQIGDFLMSVTIWVLIFLIVILFLKYVVKGITGKTKMKVDDIIVKAIRLPLLFILVLYGVVSSLKLLDIPSKLLNWLQICYNILFIILAMYALVKILSALVQVGISVSKKMNEPGVSNMLLPMTKKMGSAIIFVIGFFAILAQVGFDITIFITSMGVVGILVAFAAQDSLSNIFSGIHLLLDQSFKIGDRILLPQKIGKLYSSWGDVLHIGLRSTKVRSTDGVILTIPNKMITENYLANFSHITEPSLRVRIRVGLVPYWKNVKKAMEALERLANGHPDVQEKPRLPQVVLREFGPSDVMVELRFYVETPRAMRVVKSQLIQSILETFENEDIVISTPMSYSVETDVMPEAMGYGNLTKYVQSRKK